jgi:hypothetical protein
MNRSDKKGEVLTENVSKTLIKVIKRKDRAVAANAEAQSASESNQIAAINDEKNERHSRREIAGTVSAWISERRENNRREEIAERKNFGNEPTHGES